MDEFIRLSTAGFTRFTMVGMFFEKRLLAFDSSSIVAVLIDYD